MTSLSFLEILKHLFKYVSGALFESRIVIYGLLLVENFLFPQVRTRQVKRGKLMTRNISDVRHLHRPVAYSYKIT